MKKVFVVVVHYKGPQFTQKCLGSLKKVKASGVIVVDNAAVKSLPVSKKTDTTYIRNKTNLGFAEGNNVGIKRALKKGADYVLILNNDTVVAHDLLSQLTKVAESDSQIGLVAPKIYFAPGYEYQQTRYKPGDQGKVFWYAGGEIDWQNVLVSHRGVDQVDRGQYDKQKETSLASGCCMLVSRAVFEKIGFFDAKYFLYLEDADFCVRAHRAGFKIIFAPQGKVWHFNAGSSKVGGPLHDYYLSRNRLLFGLKWAPLRAKLALIRESCGLLLKGRPWQKKGVKDYYLRKWGKGSYEPA